MTNTPELREHIVREVRAFCVAGSAAGRNSTYLLTMLGGKMPEADPRQLSKILMDVAKRELSDCATQGEPEVNHYGKTIRRWIWHAPDPSRVPSAAKPSAPAWRSATHEMQEARFNQLDADLAEIKMMLNKLLTNGQ